MRDFRRRPPHPCHTHTHMHIHTTVQRPPPCNKRLERNPSNANHVTLFQPLPLTPRVLLFPGRGRSPAGLSSRFHAKLLMRSTQQIWITQPLNAGAERQRRVFLSKVTEKEGVEQSAGGNARFLFYGAGCISSVDS